MVGRDGSSAGGFSPLNALRAVVALLIVAGFVVVAVHYVMPTGNTKPKPNPRVQATTVRSATVAQVFAATAARLRELKGQNVRERTVMTMSMSTVQSSATVQQTTTLDSGPTRSRPHDHRANVAAQRDGRRESKHARVVRVPHGRRWHDDLRARARRAVGQGRRRHRALVFRLTATRTALRHTRARLQPRGLRSAGRSPVCCSRGR